MHMNRMASMHVSLKKDVMLLEPDVPGDHDEPGESAWFPATVHHACMATSMQGRMVLPLQQAFAVRCSMRGGVRQTRLIAHEVSLPYCPEPAVDSGGRQLPGPQLVRGTLSSKRKAPCNSRRAAMQRPRAPRAQWANWRDAHGSMDSTAIKSRSSSPDAGVPDNSEGVRQFQGHRIAAPLQWYGGSSMLPSIQATTCNGAVAGVLVTLTMLAFDACVSSTQQHCRGSTLTSVGQSARAKPNNP